ncbi:MAG: diguanylate cyclase [Candidatus Edwardsbacteria bacterium]|nr:diguanylate cyclase [Candidatus Edwardsbacteria bacterium]
MKKTNPVKIFLAAVAVPLILAMAWGKLYRPLALDSDKGISAAAVGVGFLLAAFYAWWTARNFRREPRRRWQLWQISFLTALTGLTAQLSGGLASFLLGFYLLLAWLAIFRAEGKWHLLPPIAAVVIELGSSYWGDRLYQEAVPAGFFLAMMTLGFFTGRLFAKRSLAAAIPPALQAGDAPPQEASLNHDLSGLCALAQAALGSRTCAAFQLESMGTHLKMLAYKSYSPNVADGAVIGVARSFLGWVARERQGLLYPAYDKDFRALGYYEKAEPVGSVLAVPVLLENAVRGMIVADSEKERAFDENSKLLLSGFAEQAGRLIDLHQRHSALGLEKERLEIWNKRLELLASRLKVSDVIAVMKELIPTLVDCDHLVLLDVRQNSNAATILLSDPQAVGYPVIGSEIDIAGSLAEQAAKTKEWRVVDDFYRRAVTISRYSNEEKLDHGFRSVLAGPLMYEGECRYVLALESRRPDAFDRDLSTIHIIGSQFALALKSAALYEEKEQMAVRDGLTGLANHRRFQDHLSEVLQASNGQPVGIALFDIDFFKKLNDAFGHPVGDAVLKELAARLKEKISQYDFVARYGGEEFVAVWPGRTDLEAVKLAEEVRQIIGAKKFSTAAGDLPVTISLGVAAYPQDAKDKPALIKAADEALYAAKKGGRNKVCRFAAVRDKAPL